MARLARVVAEGIPHLVTQRGNRRQPVFFSDDDYRLYRTLLAQGCQNAGVEVWGYCLMPNHVHLLLAPSDPDGLRAALGEAHRRYTSAINARKGWRGYLWQGRFASAPLEDSVVLVAARYIELNPVRARLAGRPQDWPWSSARAHLAARDDGLVAVKPLFDRVPDWSGLLRRGLDEGERESLRAGERTGRPVGSADFLNALELKLDRPLARRKPGPKLKNSLSAPR